MTYTVPGLGTIIDTTDRIQHLCSSLKIKFGKLAVKSITLSPKDYDALVNSRETDKRFGAKDFDVTKILQYIHARDVIDIKEDPDVRPGSLRVTFDL